MKISFEKLESIVIAEARAPKPYDRYRDDLFEEAIPMLYMAARSGEIELLDVLIACRHHADLTRLVAREFLRADNVVDVRTVLAVMQRDIPEFLNRQPENFVLVDWLKRAEK